MSLYQSLYQTSCLRSNVDIKGQSSEQRQLYHRLHQYLIIAWRTHVISGLDALLSFILIGRWPTDWSCPMSNGDIKVKVQSSVSYTSIWSLLVAPTSFRDWTLYSRLYSYWTLTDRWTSVNWEGWTPSLGFQDLMLTDWTRRMNYDLYHRSISYWRVVCSLGASGGSRIDACGRFPAAVY